MTFPIWNLIFSSDFKDPDLCSAQTKLFYDFLDSDDSKKHLNLYSMKKVNEDWGPSLILWKKSSPSGTVKMYHVSQTKQSTRIF